MTAAGLLDAGLSAHQAGRLSEAEALYRRILAADAGQPDALHLLGVVAHQLGRHDEAASLIGRAIGINPGNPEYHNNFGRVCEALRRFTDAAHAYGKALALAPHYAVAYNNLGNVLHTLDRFEEAEKAYHSALKHAPEYVEAAYNLGNLLLSRGRTAEAITCFREALCIRPDFADALKNLGNALLTAGETDAAADTFRHLLQKNPSDADAWCNLGNVLKQQGFIGDALEAYRRAIAEDPALPVPWSNFLYSLHFHPACTNAMIADAHRAWRQTLVTENALPLAYPNDPTPGRRLRIGYVSPDFYHQAEAFFVLPLFAAHDGRLFEIHAFSSVTKEDETTARLRRSVAMWHDVRRLDDRELAEYIAAQRIDILVDLTMHMANHRLKTFARKPAPVQVSWLAYPGSTGLPAIGYRLTDCHMEPADLESEGSAELPVRLPDAWCCYDPIFECPPCGPLPAGSAATVTFGSLNNPCKHNDAVIDLWSKVLLAVAGSRLRLLCPEGSARGRFVRAFGTRGIPAERLAFAAPANRHRYLSYYSEIDIGLDPFPYNGITTTCDSLWMGVPVLTLPGQTPASRAGASLLKTVGLADWVATSEADFIEKALIHSSDRARLAGLRGGLRQRMAESPLTDAPRFARAVEDAYRGMWRAWCETMKGRSRLPSGLQ